MENKENKRIIQGYYSNITLNVVFLLIFTVVIFNVIIPGYNEYKNNKEVLLNNISEFEKLEKNGLSFTNFSQLITDKGAKDLVTKIGADFFNNNLKNTSSKIYLDFIKEKEKKVNELKKSDQIKLRDEKVSKILPSYQEGVSIDGSMTDLEFVNYIESMLRSFRLKSDSKIGIDNLVLVGNKSEKDDNISLGSQIFYIPLKLEIEGAKADIADFLYFLQNVGKIETIKNNDIIIYKDRVLNKSIGGSSNIFENKLVDIESIELKDYIDTSSFIRSTSGEKTTIGFLNFIRNGIEKTQAFKINISLRFYVKGLPTYKLEAFISKTIESYKQKIKLTTDNLKNIQSKKGSNTTTEIINIISNLRSIETYLIDMEQTIKRLELGVKEKTNLERLYIDASKAKYDIDNINSILDENIKKIKNLYK